MLRRWSKHLFRVRAIWAENQGRLMYGIFKTGSAVCILKTLGVSLHFLATRFFSGPLITVLQFQCGADAGDTDCSLSVFYYTRGF
jgi:hypothetical protein